MHVAVAIDVCTNSVLLQNLSTLTASPSDPGWDYNLWDYNLWDYNIHLPFLILTLSYLLKHSNTIIVITMATRHTTTIITPTAAPTSIVQLRESIAVSIAAAHQFVHYYLLRKDIEGY